MCRNLGFLHYTAEVVGGTYQPVEGMCYHGSVAPTNLHRCTGRQPTNGTRCCFGKFNRNAADLFSRYAGNRRCPFRRAVFQLNIPPFDQTIGIIFFKRCFIYGLSGNESVLAIDKITHKFTTPQAFDENHMRHRYCQCAVFSGNNRQPFVSFGCSS